MRPFCLLGRRTSARTGGLPSVYKLGGVATWFRRKPRRIDSPRVRPRSEELATTKVELIEFTPPLIEFLGRAAYIELTLFENLSRAISTAPTVSAKAALGRGAELTLARHRTLLDELAAAGADPAEAMNPYTKPADEFERETHGGDWYETVLTCYLTTGFLDDFLGKLAAGLPHDAARIAAIFGGETAETTLATELETAIEAHPRLASRLAMWGRRLVGDTMLLARSALVYSADHLSDEARIEPVFSELIAAHTRRMDALGLTA